MDEVRAYAPGRVEIAGNHVDHQGGRVIAATIDVGIRMQVRKRADGIARVDSEGFRAFELDASDVAARTSERATSAALVRGVIAGLRAAGIDVAGFEARVQSNVPAGGGLSSSAAFELALCQALALLYGENLLDAERAARICQAAERDWFGKPCGLMDQLAIALGGMNELDFGGEPVRAQGIDFDFESAGHALVIADVHCDHSRYTEAYAQVAADMSDVARLMGARVLAEVPERDFMQRFADVRRTLGDVPALRGLHFYREMALVDERARALRAGDMDAFLDATRQSARSSAQYLQNVSTFDRASQPAMVALALADHLLAGRGAARIHGGGFGGTIQAFVPLDQVDEFIADLDAHLGAGSCARLRVTGQGASAEGVSTQSHGDCRAASAEGTHAQSRVIGKGATTEESHAQPHGTGQGASAEGA